MTKLSNFLKESTVAGNYPTDGTGVSGDDDLPTGTVILGDKFVPEIVPNRLTGATKRYVPATTHWNWDEFDNCSGMGSQVNYSTTLDSMEAVFGERFWSHIAPKRSSALQKDKAEIRRSNDIDQTANLGDDKPESAEEIRQPPQGVTEQIERYLYEEDLGSAERRDISKAIMGHRSLKIKIKNMNLEVKITDLKNGTKFEYPENIDFTLALVDISDTMGLKFTEETKNKKTIFIIKE